MIKLIALILLVQISLNCMNIIQQKISFKKFLQNIEDVDHSAKTKLTDEFYEIVKSSDYPLFENDSTAILLYKGKEDSVYLIGDMSEWTDFIPLKKIDGTDLFYHIGKYEPAARLEYWFTYKINGLPFVDSLNKKKSLNGLGELSVLAMPSYIPHNFFKDYEEGKKGGLTGLKEFTVPSNYMEYDHKVHVYLPPDYDENKKYSAVYFQDGLDYIQFGLAAHSINELIKSSETEPLIAVFVTPPNLHKPKIPNRMTEYGMNDNYVKFFTEELIQFIEQKFSINSLPEKRLVVGDSYGGLISTYIAFSRADIFQNVYSQSGYLSFNDDRMIQLISDSQKKQIKLYVDIGTYEKNVGAAFLPATERNFIEANRRFKNILEKKEYDFIYREYCEGHTWGNWRRHLIDALKYFFGNPK